MTKQIIVLKDCRHMDEVPDSSVQFCVNSPPYGQLKEYSADTKQIGNLTDELQIEELQKVYRECFKKLKDTGFLAVNIGDYVHNDYKRALYPFFAELTKAICDVGFIFHRNLIWSKDKYSGQFIGRKTKYCYHNNTEYILIFSKKEILVEEGEEFKGVTHKMNKDNIWTILPSFGEEGKHTAMYPVELINPLIQIYSSEGDWILDPFLGSGTTMLSAKLNKRNCYGYELNKDNLPLIKKKIGMVQKGLFDNDTKFEVIE